MSNSLEQLKAAGTVSHSHLSGGDTGNPASVESVLVRWQALRESMKLEEIKLANAL